MTDAPRVSVRDVDWSEPLLPRTRDPALESVARRGGQVWSGMAYFAPVPWVYLALVRLNQQLLRRRALDHDLADMAGLVVSQDNSCRYCYAVQRTLLRTVGIDEERILKLEETLLLSEHGRRERTALEFARRLSRSNPLLTKRDVLTLHEAGFDAPEIQDLLVVCGLLILFNRTSTILAIPPHAWEQAPDRWLARLARPLMSVWVRSRFRGRAESSPLAEEQKRGPFSHVTNALDGHPVAGTLREALDEMWQSSHLSRRAKALCFAVVARALSCRRSEQEAAALAMDEGFSEETVERVLANLSSPELDDVERQVVPFSRQTVWYQVPDLQRRARQLREALPNETFIETVFVTSLANTMCRLGFVADAP